MPTNDELHKADQMQAQAIAELRMRVNGHDDDIARHEKHIAKLDEAVTVLREGMARVATKDDISGLRRDLDERHAKQLTQAQDSIPGKIGLLLTGGSLVVMLITLFLNHHG
jgi:predicted  nucleic acid-binding Zn-ribbon protein